MSDDLAADAVKLRFLSDQLHNANEQVGAVSAWLTEFDGEVTTVCGPDSGAYRDLHGQVLFGQKMLREYREYMNHTVRVLKEMADRMGIIS
jgi:hypothetical protein